jgi:hypothetical protein
VRRLLSRMSRRYGNFIGIRLKSCGLAALPRVAKIVQIRVPRDDAKDPRGHGRIPRAVALLARHAPGPPAPGFFVTDHSLGCHRSAPSSHGLVRIRSAPHAGRPKLARPTSLKFTYGERAVGTGVSILPPIGAISFGLVTQVTRPRRRIGLAKPAANNKNKHGGAG